MSKILKVLEYRRQIKELQDEGNVFYEKADSEKREFTPEEQGAVDKIKAAIRATEAHMDSYMELNGIDTEELRSYVPNRPEPGAKSDIPKPFRSLGEQLQAVANAALNRGIDQRLYEVRAASGLNETIPGEGGFLVQQDFTAELLTQMYDTNEIPRRCRRIPISSNSNSFAMNAVDESSRATGSRWGGVQVYRAAEAGTTTATKPKFSKIEMKLEKIFGLCYATDELLADASALGAVITEAFTEEMGFKVSDEIIRGDGAGKCLGILSSGALVTITKETGQPADTVVTENILKMWKSRRGRNFTWLYNQELEDQLRTLVLAIGMGGVPMPLFVPPTGNSQNATIMGAPALAAEVASGPGDVGDIILADLNQYLLIDKGGIQTAQSMHVNFTTDEMTYRFIYRVNGQPMVKSKITPYKRTDSNYYVSPFVTLGAR